MKVLEDVGGHWQWNPDSLNVVFWCLDFSYCLVRKFPSKNPEGYITKSVL